MSYFPELDSHIKVKVKVVLDFSNQVTEKKLEHATGIDTFDSTAKKGFIVLKVEVDKLDIIKLTNFPTNLKTKGDDLDVGKLKN